jgi:hypothetical protein
MIKIGNYNVGPLGHEIAKLVVYNFNNYGLWYLLNIL